MASLPLSDLIAALAGDIDRANLRADLARMRMARIYAEDELLADSLPSQMRVVEATVSLPVALESVEESAVVDPGIPERELRDLLPREIADRDRAALTGRLLADAGGRNRLFSPELPQAMREALRIAAPQLDGKALDAFEHSVEARAAQGRGKALGHPGLRCLYRFEDLEKVGPDRIVRVSISLALS